MTSSQSNHQMAVVRWRATSPNSMFRDCAQDFIAAREDFKRRHNITSDRPPPPPSAGAPNCYACLHGVYDVIHQQDGGEPRDDCPICLGELTFALATNCGHQYCCQCLMTYWGEHHSQISQLKCPTCRTDISSLRLRLTQLEWGSIMSEAEKQAVDRVMAYNRRFSGGPMSLSDQLQLGVIILRHSARTFFSVRGLLWLFWFRVVWLLLSVVSSLFLWDDEKAYSYQLTRALLEAIDSMYMSLLLAVYLSVMYRQGFDDDDDDDVGGEDDQHRFHEANLEADP